jgi:pterin-4a-carbinolamine dehydratase
LTTHDEGDVVTAKDRRLASAIDEIMKKRAPIGALFNCISL